jgi:hypothetical protein
MLELRPICEQCAAPLPPESPDAMICTFECTFCRDCADDVLVGVCPNCGGGFVPRPIRPAQPWKGANLREMYPPATERLHHPVDPAEHARFAAPIRGLAPESR